MTPCLALPLRSLEEARAEIAAKRAMLALVKLSPTMEAINRAVEALPAFPAFPPLADDKPCDAPQRWRGYPSWHPICKNCGHLMGEHHVR